MLAANAHVRQSRAGAAVIQQILNDGQIYPGAPGPVPKRLAQSVGANGVGDPGESGRPMQNGPRLTPLEGPPTRARRKQRITQGRLGARRQIGAQDLLDTGIQGKVLALAGFVFHNHNAILPLGLGAPDIAKAQSQHIADPQPGINPDAKPGGIAEIGGHQDFFHGGNLLFGPDRFDCVHTPYHNRTQQRVDQPFCLVRREKCTGRMLPIPPHGPGKPRPPTRGGDARGWIANQTQCPCVQLAHSPVRRTEWGDGVC